MANFIIVIDPDPERRSRFAEKATLAISPVPGLQVASCSAGQFFCVWAAHESAPIDFCVEDESAAVIWGDAIRGQSSARMNAPAIKECWNPPSGNPEVFDGYHAAVVYHNDSTLTVGADPLGLFPIFYFAGADMIVAGSSPELFRHHPSFRSKFNPSGLLSILLTMQSVDGETLWADVKRLKAGHCLCWSRTKAAREVASYPIPITRKYFDLPMSAHVGLLDQALDRAVRRHVGSRKRSTLLLSGGLDSRILGGYLQTGNLEMRALTLGLPDEQEVQCAARVAGALGFRQEIREIGEVQYPELAHTQSTWEHGTTGFNTIIDWGVYPFLRTMSSTFVGGHVMDTIVGPYLDYKDSSGMPSFERFFDYLNGNGIRVEALKRLLRSEVFGDVEDSIARIRKIYEGYSCLESQRSWAFKINHRARLHVGGVLWKLSFGAWPIVPGTDREVLECAGGMPAASLAERRAEKDLLCGRFAPLAEIPLDRMSNEPMLPRFRWMLRRQFQWRAERLRRVITNSRKQNVNRNQRLYNLNGRGWKLVRHQTEALRKPAYEFFRRETLDELLPPPESEISHGNSINSVSGIKSLIGFLLWLKDHPC